MGEIIDGRWPDRDSVASGGSPPHDPGMDARVAVLEQIAKETREALAGLRSDLRSEIGGLRSEIGGLRSEMIAMRTELKGEIAGLRNDARGDFRWLLTLMIGFGAGILGLLGRGFHWLG